LRRREKKEGRDRPAVKTILLAEFRNDGGENHGKKKNLRKGRICRSEKKERDSRTSRRGKGLAGASAPGNGSDQKKKNPRYESESDLDAKKDDRHATERKEKVEIPKKRSRVAPDEDLCQVRTKRGNGGATSKAMRMEGNRGTNRLSQKVVELREKREEGDVVARRKREND